MWRLEVRPEVFVAMNFDPIYNDRFENVIAPAISAISVNRVALQARRVDLSGTGDSIITEILDGIAHSQLVLADVSTCGNDAATTRPYRNGNVMFEVGVALACRQPEEILIVRDDNHKCLFDVSAIPHATLNFTEHDEARLRLTEALLARLELRQYVRDSRVQLAVKCLSPTEGGILQQIAAIGTDKVWFIKRSATVPIRADAAISRLLDKELIENMGSVDDSQYAFRATLLGRATADVYGGLPRLISPETPDGEKPVTGCLPLPDADSD